MMEKLEKFTLYIGLNDQHTKVQEISTLDAYKIVRSIAAQYFDGITVSEACGIYKHDDGTFVTENTLRVEILFADLESVKAFSDKIKQVLNQESVAMQRESVESQLI